MSFKTSNPFCDRKAESDKMLAKYPDRIPIICEKNQKSKNTPEIDKNKYLVPFDLTVGQFMYVIRKRIKLAPEQGIFLFMNGYIPASSHMLNDLYCLYKDDDGFLYVTYSSENTFGS
jgi:GABA(A) receptor-associated protein